jgi:hypothetical protein
LKRFSADNCSVSLFLPPKNLKTRNAKKISIWYGLGITSLKFIIMKQENKQPVQDNSNTVKNPDEWTTGAEEMTGAQKSYLNTLAQEAGEEINEDLTKAEASKKIDELQHKTGRGIER